MKMPALFGFIPLCRAIVVGESLRVNPSSWMGSTMANTTLGGVCAETQDLVAVCLCYLFLRRTKKRTNLVWGGLIECNALLCLEGAERAGPVSIRMQQLVLI